MKIALFALSFGALAAAARAGDVSVPAPRNLAAIDQSRQPVLWMQEGYNEMGAALERARAYEKEAKGRGLVLSKETRPAVPVGTLPGKCVPFQVPAPHKSMQDYCRALQRMPWK